MKDTELLTYNTQKIQISNNYTAFYTANKATKPSNRNLNAIHFVSFDISQLISLTEIPVS